MNETAPEPRPRVLVIAGPTASGKSALALRVAVAHPAVIINADAAQRYRDLRILTARPTPEDEARAPHALYGTLPAAEPGTAASWRIDAAAAIDAARAAGRLPLLCGGTGLYLATLAGGIADIPDPGPDARREARALLAADGAPALHARLVAADPATAARLRPTDGQRLARAWEVWRGTGRGLRAWQDAAAAVPPPFRFGLVLLRPDRAGRPGAIRARFDAMLAAGALDEVARLLARDLPPDLPLLRAHGVPELAAHLRGALPLPDAAARAVSATIRYARRQDTWFRHHAIAAPDDTFLMTDPNDAQQSESLDRFLGRFLHGPG